MFDFRGEKEKIERYLQKNGLQKDLIISDAETKIYRQDVNDIVHLGCWDVTIKRETEVTIWNVRITILVNADGKLFYDWILITGDWKETFKALNESYKKEILGMYVTPTYITYQRERLGWTPKELAQHVGVSKNTVKKWEAGKSVPRKNSRVALLDLRNRKP
jgi:DNA-binding transcriptional regulator YiaG